MPRLHDLPTELLAELFSYFASEKQLLRNLALQCHCFNFAIRRVLLRQVTLILHEERSLLKVELLSRSLGDDPALGRLVHTLSLDMLRIDRINKTHAHEIVQDLLRQLPSLCVLTIKDNSDPPCFEPVFLDANRMCRLTSLTINDSNLTLQKLTPYMFLEKLSHLNVLWIRNPTSTTFDFPRLPRGAEWSIPQPPDNRKAGSSPVVLLDFGPVFHLPEEVLKEILSWPKALQRFRGTIPGKDVPLRFGISKKLSTTLSPASISRALSPTKNSLQSLELIDNACQWPGHDQSKMDLSDFKSLTKIDVPSTCFFKRFTYGVKKDGMYTLLPPSLVELRIMYDLDDVIRPDREERLSIPTRASNFENAGDELWRQLNGLSMEYCLKYDLLDFGNPKDLKWLLELAENKRDHFPNLKRVSLMERCGLLRSGIHPMNWTLPSTIKIAFEDAGIEFRAVMRKPSLASNID